MATAELVRPTLDLETAAETYLSVAAHGAFFTAEDVFVFAPPETGEDLSELTEEEWKKVIRDARTGDEATRQAAFSEIYTRKHGKIYRHVNRMLQSGTEDAENFTSDVFVKALKKIAETDDDLKLEAWLFTIATNTCLSELRRRKVIKWNRLEKPEGGLLVDPISPEKPDEDAIRSLLPGDVEIVMGLIPQKYREILNLREYGQLSYNEIADVLGKSRDNVKRLLHAARVRFRKAWEEFQSMPKWSYTKLVLEGKSLVNKTALQPRQQQALFIRLLSNIGYELPVIASHFDISVDEVNAYIEATKEIDDLIKTKCKTRKEICAMAAIKELAVINSRATDPSVPHKLISRRLGITMVGVGKIITRLLRVGFIPSLLASPKELKDREKRIIELRAKNPQITAEQLALVLGCSYSDIRNTTEKLIKRKKLAPRRDLQGRLKWLRRHLRDYKKAKPGEKVSMTDVAETMKVCVSTADRLYKILAEKEKWLPKKLAKGERRRCIKAQATLAS